MKILVLGAYESNNLGDAVICECVSQIIQEHFSDTEITIQDLLSRNRRKAPGKTDFKLIKKREYINHVCRLLSQYTPVDLVYQLQQRRLAAERAYLEEVCASDYDLVVFAGGQMFMDSYALFLHYCVMAFQKKGTPVLFHACGSGPSYSPQIRRLLAETLSASNVCSISCRDNTAAVRELLKGSKKTVLDTYDAALSSARIYAQQKNAASDTIGLGIMYANSLHTKKVSAFWRSVIRQLDRQEIKWKIFTNGAASDDAYARRILSSMPEYRNREDAYLVPRDTEPEGLVRTISQFSALLSFRLHSHILAVSLDIPSVAVVWDKKLPAFFRKIGYPERCFQISDSAEEIVEELRHTMLSGYDRSVIEKQIQVSDSQLIAAIQDILSKQKENLHEQSS